MLRNIGFKKNLRMANNFVGCAHTFLSLFFSRIFFPLSGAGLFCIQFLLFLIFLIVCAQKCFPNEFLSFFFEFIDSFYFQNVFALYFNFGF